MDIPLRISSHGYDWDAQLPAYIGFCTMHLGRPHISFFKKGLPATRVELQVRLNWPQTRQAAGLTAESFIRKSSIYGWILVNNLHGLSTISTAINY
jgi:hypothetical protein